MLSLFPSLLSFQQLSPFLIRITLAAVLIYWAYKGMTDPTHSTKTKILDFIQGILGLMIFFGVWTQAAAGLVALGQLYCIVQKIRTRAFLSAGVNYVLILFVMAVSLLFSGPGWFSFDLPL